jgi:hypothetical protein
VDTPAADFRSGKVELHAKCLFDCKQIARTQDADLIGQAFFRNRANLVRKRFVWDSGNVDEGFPPVTGGGVGCQRHNLHSVLRALPRCY